MGIVYETHVAIGGVPSEITRRLAETHAVRLRAHGTPPPALDWSLTILQGLRRAARDGIAVWGGGGKGMGLEVRDALAPFFRELLTAHPEARILYAEESDSDEGDDGDVARWTEFSGREETFVERTMKIACRINMPEKYDDDDDEDEDEEPPLDIDGIATSPTWKLAAPRVHVLGYGSFYDRDDAARLTAVTGLRDAAAKSTPAHVRECLGALADAIEQWKDAAWPSWGHVGAPVDVAALAEALRPLMFALVVYQPEGETAKIARVESGAITHHDLPVGLAWVPALSPAPAAKIEARVASAPAARSIVPSPHREALFQALAGASRIGLKDQPAFQSLLTLSPAERRALLVDVGADSPPAVTSLVEGIVYLLLDFSVVVESEDDLLALFAAEASLSSGRAVDALIGLTERFIARHRLSAALAGAVLSSPGIASRAQRAPAKPDRYAKKEIAYRSLVLWRAAESAA